MRKLLTLISAVGLGATGTVAASNVVSCSKKAANDLGKIKGDDLKIVITDTKNNTDNYVKDEILKKINKLILIDKDGKEVKAEDSNKLTFALTDFTFNSEDKDFAFPKDLSKAFEVVVAPVTGDSASDNAKALKGSATFSVTPKSGDAPTPVVKIDLSTIKADSLKLSIASYETEDKVKAQILLVVKTVAKDATNEDFDVTSSVTEATPLAVGSTYEVTAKADSAKIKGTATFQIVA